MYNLTAVTTVKNEQDSILEWLSFHSIVGFDHFIILLDDCTDDTESVIRNSKYYNKCKLLYRQEIHVPTNGSLQIHFYKWAIEYLQDKSVWMLGFDVDEFVSTSTDKELQVELENYQQYSGVIVNSLIFGSNNLKNRDDLVINSFTQRSDLNNDVWSFDWPIESKVDNSWFKVIIKPQLAVGYGNAHFPITKTPFVHEDHTKYKGNNMGRTDKRSVDVLRMNHYFTKSRTEWLRKLERGRISGSNTYIDELYYHYQNCNIVDTTIKDRFGTIVKQDLNDA